MPIAEKMRGEEERVRMSTATRLYSTTVRAALLELRARGYFEIDSGYLRDTPERLLLEMGASPGCDAPAELELPAGPHELGALYVGGTAVPVACEDGQWVDLATWPTTLDPTQPQEWEIYPAELLDHLRSAPDVPAQIPPSGLRSVGHEEPRP
jgi:hypothetical protein